MNAKKAIVSVENLPDVLNVKEMMAVKGGEDSSKCQLVSFGKVTN